MADTVDLQKIERRAYRASFEDGLTDVQLGAVFVLMSFVVWFEEWGVKRPFGYLIVFALLFAVWYGIKTVKMQMVLPRMGTAVFSPTRNNRTKQARIALAVMVAATVGLLLLTVTGALQTVIGDWSPYLFIGAVFVVTLSLLAFFLDYPRLYAYGWFLAVMDPFGVWMEAQTGWVFPGGATVFGTIIVLIGLATFARFLSRHPLLPETAV